MTEQENYASYDDFKKLKMQIGLIRFVEPIPETDKLLRFEIDFGEKEGEELPFGKEEYRGRDVRQIVSGIREYYPDYESLVGKKVLYVTNLEPRVIRGVRSDGMLMAVDGPDGNPRFLVAEGDVEPGASVR